MRWWSVRSRAATAEKAAVMVQAATAQQRRGEQGARKEGGVGDRQRRAVREKVREGVRI
jgi:hypothetical protein